MFLSFFLSFFFSSFLVFFLSSVLSSFHSCPLSAATAKVAAHRRVTVNKQNQTTSRKTVFGVTSTEFFWVGDNDELEAKSREEPSLAERSRWPGQPRRRGWRGTGGVERFGGGEGKAHLLYSWPLCVKQALWAVTELERRASERPLALLCSPPLFLSVLPVH